MQLGIPITIINGGIKAINIDRGYPSVAMVPSDQITVTATMVIQITTTRTDLKKKYIKSELTNIESPIKMYISD